MKIVNVGHGEFKILWGIFIVYIKSEPRREVQSRFIEVVAFEVTGKEKNYGVRSNDCKKNPSEEQHK